MKKIILLTLLLLFSCSKDDNTALIDSYVSQISSLNSQITLLNSQIINLQAEVTNLRNNPETVTVTETVFVQDDSAVEALQAKVTELNNTITALQAQITELENNPVVVTETVFVQDDSAVEALQAKVTELNNTITALQAQITELENNPVTETVTETVLVTVTVPTNPTTVEHGVDGGITKIFSDETWKAESIHIIRGKVVVMNGASLTIEPGTIIKAGEGQLADATALVVARGGQIIANGTYAQPIIMTDINDNISLTSASTNRTSADRGLWGGLVILGRAKISNSSPEKAVEGIGGISGEIWDYYGGDNNSDSSGVLNYVSIRHTGIEVAPDEEIQGLTLGGVGSGTSIKNIEILGADDDGVEFFGGSVDIENIVIVNANDDSIDVDMAYSGTILNAVVELGYDSDTAFEMDGSKVASYRAKNLITGLTIYGRYPQTATDSDQLGKVRENFQGTVTNVHVFGDALESSSFETFTNMDGTYNFNSYQHTFGTTVSGSEDVIFSDWYFNGEFTQSTITKKASSVEGFNIDAVFPFWATIGTSPRSTQGADEGVFGWTVWFQEK